MFKKEARPIDRACSLKHFIHCSPYNLNAFNDELNFKTVLRCNVIGNPKITPKNLYLLIFLLKL